MRASTSAWPSGESLGRSVACWGVLLAASERRPRKSAVATLGCALDAASGVAIVAAGATVATAAARAARRANSRREIRPVLAGLGLVVSAIRMSGCVLAVK